MLGFPCNQFGKQEPGGADEIEQTCHVNYGVSFPMFEKVDVDGPAAHPLFRYLKQALPGVFGGRIKWNFTKFLIGRDGTPLTRVLRRSRRRRNGSLHCRGPHALSVPIMPRSPSGGWLPIQGRRRSHAASNRLLLANLPPARSSAYSGDTASTSCLKHIGVGESSNASSSG